MFRYLRFTLVFLLSAGAPTIPQAQAGFDVPMPDFSRIEGVWVGRKELLSLPMSGPAWDRLAKEAHKPLPPPNVSDQDDPASVIVLSMALVYARTGHQSYKDQVIEACMAVIGTEKGGRTLSLGRKLLAYVIAADLVGLPPDADQRFKTWLRKSLSTKLEGRTLRSTQEDRPNNWGLHAAASRAAVAIYLRDVRELYETARVFKGYLGDRNAHSGFLFGALDWQSDPERPVGINPKGATKDGYNIDGILPDDQRRCCKRFTWPPPYENYVFEALQGALATAMLLDRYGYDVWNWQDKALLRAFKWLYEVAGYRAENDDTWLPYVINYYYGTSFPVDVPSKPGKGIGFTDWVLGPEKARARAR